jgi:hypothetical protein
MCFALRASLTLSALTVLELIPAPSAWPHSAISCFDDKGCRRALAVAMEQERYDCPGHKLIGMLNCVDPRPCRQDILHAVGFF